MLVRIPRAHVRRLAHFRTITDLPRSPIRSRYSLATIIVAGAVAGTVGGGLLIGAGYFWYLNSPIKRAVDTVRPALMFLTDTRAELGKKAPSHVLSHLRQACKAYLAYMPGSSYFVDRGFDAIDDVVDAHAEEANAIIGDAVSEITKVIQRDGNNHNTSTVLEVTSITRKLLKKLTALGAKAGRPLSEKLDLEKRTEQLKSGTAAAYESVKTAQASVTQAVSETVEKEHIPESGISSTISNAAGKVKRRIFPKSEDE